MISRVLFTLQAGFTALRLHTKFIFVIAVLFLFPLLIIHIEESATTVAKQNIETTQKETISVLHFTLRESFVSENDKTAFLEKIQTSLGTPTEVYLYKLVPETIPEIIARTSEEAPAVDDFVFQVIPNNGEVFIFENNENGRVWYGASKIVLDNIEYVYVSVHDYTSVEAVFAARTKQIYTSISIGFVFLLLVVYWLIRQINWEARYKKLEDVTKEEELLITTTTHEFRAPLTAIRGYGSFLRESNRLRPRDLETLDKIDMSTERLLHLVNDFLEVAKIQAGTLKIVATKVPVIEVVYRVLGALGSGAAEKGLILRDGTQKQSITLVTDVDRLEQILTNVVSNAIKYTNRGSVVVTYEQNPLFLTIRVQDTGSGISADDQAKLFRPFSRVGHVEETAIVGSGLGMWITKRLVERLGGTIKIESIKDVGTHIVIKFDLRKIASMTQTGIL